jgi:hypothetical protein
MIPKDVTASYPKHLPLCLRMSSGSRRYLQDCGPEEVSLQQPPLKVNKSLATLLIGGKILQWVLSPKVHI